MDTSNAPLRPGVALKTGEDGVVAISADDEEIDDNSQTLDSAQLFAEFCSRVLA